MVRTPCRDENGMKKGTWTPDEDRKLIAYVTRYGCWNWRQLPKFAGLSRCGKSCRLRWMNYLRPNIKRGNYSKEEEETIVKLHEKLGNRWSAIAAQLPGRTDNEIKNHWHTNLKKRKNNKQCNSSFSSSATNTEETPSYSSLDAAVDQPIKKAIFPNEESTATPQVTQKTDDRVDNSSQLSPSPQPSSSEVSSMSADNNFVNWVDDINVTSMEAYAVSQFIDDNQFIDDFWTEPFLADNSYIPSGFYTPLMDSEFMYPLFGGDFL